MSAARDSAETLHQLRKAVEQIAVGLANSVGGMEAAALFTVVTGSDPAQPGPST